MTSLEHPRYHQDRLIAVGGMGEVWEATDTVLKRQVALKVLKKEYADDATFRARFDAEAKHAAALSHPNVAGVLDYGEVPGAAPGEPDRPYLVMELVRGEPLSTLLKGGRAARPAAGRRARSPRPPPASTPPTGSGSSTATSSPATCWSPPTGR